MDGHKGLSQRFALSLSYKRRRTTTARPLTQVVFVACGVSRLAGLMDCFLSNTLQGDCRDDCRVSCPCGYYDGKACSTPSSTCGGSCAKGSSRLLMLVASACCCAAGNRAPLPCCARCDDLRYAVVACRALRGSTAIVYYRARGGAWRGGWGVWLASSCAPARSMQIFVQLGTSCCACAAGCRSS